MDIRIIILLLFLGITFVKYPILLLILSATLLVFVLLVEIGFVDYIHGKLTIK